MPASGKGNPKTEKVVEPATTKEVKPKAKKDSKK